MDILNNVLVNATVTVQRANYLDGEFVEFVANRVPFTLESPDIGRHWKKGQVVHVNYSYHSVIRGRKPFPKGQKFYPQQF